MSAFAARVGFVVAVILGVSTVASAHPAWLTLYNTHTGEHLRVRLLRSLGRIDLLEWRRIDQLLRDRHNGHARAIHPQLIRALIRLQHAFPGREILVISGYRSPEPGRDVHTYHAVGRACDLRLRAKLPLP